MTDVAMAELSLESPSNQIQSEIAMSLTSEDGDSTTTTNRNVTVSKPIPYTFDLGNLLCSDANPLPNEHTNADIDAAARDCAQGLINQLLTTCAITSTQEGVSISLPDANTPLPREKSIPTPKEPTKWELFAKKKGIAAKRKEGNKVYDEASGEWVPKYGYGAPKKGEDDWLVEVDEKKESASGEAGDVRKERREERMERIKRQERRERANERKQARK